MLLGGHHPRKENFWSIASKTLAGLNGKFIVLREQLFPQSIPPHNYRRLHRLHELKVGVLEPRSRMDAK